MPGLSFDYEAIEAEINRVRSLGIDVPAVASGKDNRPGRFKNSFTARCPRRCLESKPNRAAPKDFKMQMPK
jgi:hypothetical protein